jgi:hypothetical protein
MKSIGASALAALTLATSAAAATPPAQPPLPWDVKLIGEMTGAWHALTPTVVDGRPVNVKFEVLPGGTQSHAQLMETFDGGPLNMEFGYVQLLVKDQVLIHINQWAPMTYSVTTGVPPFAKTTQVANPAPADTIWNVTFPAAKMMVLQSPTGGQQLVFMHN